MKIIKLFSEIFKDLRSDPDVVGIVFCIIAGLIFMGFGELLKYILGDLYFGYFMAGLFIVFFIITLVCLIYSIFVYIKRKWKSLD